MRKKEPHIIFNPDSKLWIGVCESFIHAFITMRKQHEPEQWFIGKASEHKLTIANEGGWLQLAVPEPLIHNSVHRPYRGKLSQHDHIKREKAKIREQKRRDRIRANRLFPPPDYIPPWD